MAYSIAVSAGEASGDMYGARLADELKVLLTDPYIWGAGGAKMRDAGVDVKIDMAGGGTIGISESLRALPGLAAKYLRLRGELLRSRPDVFVPIDFGAFNIRLAQIAHRNGIPVVYYMPPSSWRKRPKNAEKLRACGGKVITPFPWSAEILGSQGINAKFVGHPLIDIVKPSQGKSEFLRDLGLSESLPTIGLLPGSRGHEIKEHLKPMIGCAEIMRRELGGAQFVIGAANRADSIRERVHAATLGKESSPEIRVIEGRTYDCIAHSDFLITKSGTSTLEATLLGVPMVIIYRGSAIMRFEFLFRHSVLEDHIGLPNIIAGRGVCPELINNDVTAEKVADVALGFMKDSVRLDKMKTSLGEIRRMLGEPGAAGRVARAVVEMGGLG
ncbi:MAG: lipid-A-disaccharide synthase [Armatimonadetes bacterium]|nr:lipid-A-disaccharide synthase [Armatimonadota bacterium]